MMLICTRPPSEFRLRRRPSCSLRFGNSVERKRAGSSSSARMAESIQVGVPAGVLAVSNALWSEGSRVGPRGGE